jgi:hypothetical protein
LPARRLTTFRIVANPPHQIIDGITAAENVSREAYSLEYLYEVVHNNRLFLQPIIVQ